MSRQKKKIVFILPALIAGGAERVLITLMNSLDRECYEICLVTISGRGTLGALIDEDIPLYCLEQNNVFYALPRLYRQLKEIKPDLVVSTMAHMNFSVLLLKRFFPDIRFIVREAITPSFILGAHPFLAGVIRKAYTVLYRRADAIISPAQKIIDEFNEMQVAVGKHILLRNPVDEASMEQARLACKKKGGEDTVHFIAAGRLHRQKGFDRLLEELYGLEMPYSWHLTILGEGEERARLKQLIVQHQLESEVSLPGLVDKPWPYIACADCFLLPSRWEGLPNVVLESLACGTPVIAMNTAGGIQEIADLASPQAVTVVATMKAFVDAMEKVKPRQVEKSGSSPPTLLPASFQKKKIVAEFSSLVARIAQQPVSL